jgi:hypothetical protein
MKSTLVFLLAVSPCAFAQDGIRTDAVYQSASPGVVAARAIGRGIGSTVQGAPYSATITNESIQTLADGTHIVQNSSGTTARDSQGRTRQDTPLPAIGNMSIVNAPHLVFIIDPVAQTSYTLNMTDKTAQKISMPGGGAEVSGSAVSGGPSSTKMFFIQSGGGATPGNPPLVLQNRLVGDEESQVSTEDLGSQTMEGLLVNGVRTTRTIAEGQIGNDKPISVVTEVWTSPDLKTVVYSKRTDPRMGEQTFKLTSVVRAEPDASLFTVPADFKMMDGSQNVFFRSNQ